MIDETKNEVAEAAMPPKKRGGRPSKLTPELQEAICTSIKATKISLVDAARALGLDDHTVNDWITRGKREQRGRFHAFAVAVAKARAEGTQILLARIAKAGTMPKHWQAAQAVLTMTEPQYAVKVRLEVGRQLKDVVERVTQALAGHPEMLELVLTAMAGGPAEEESDG